MGEYEIIVDKLKQNVKEYGRIIFVALVFFVGVFLGNDLDFNVNAVIITISFLLGCLIVLVLLIDILKGEDEK